MAKLKDSARTENGTTLALEAHLWTLPTPDVANRHFYRYKPPRPLEIIETDIKRLESEILDLLKEVTA